MTSVNNPMNVNRSQLPSRSVAKRPDLSELVEMDEVARILGLANRRVVSVYRVRYADFPKPAIEKGRCLLWFHADIERWAKATGRLPRP
jgi:predicted DNA-binding transcriptional regulator AlpA